MATANQTPKSRSHVYKALNELDPEKTRIAAETICTLFEIPSLRDYQVQAGQNALRGKNTFLDIPTGGGKTLAFYYPLFYHWQPGQTSKKSQKTILVLGPLSRLLGSQAAALNKVGVPAVAMTRETKDLDIVLKDFGSAKYRVGFAGPEMALSPKFHQLVLENPDFQCSITAVVVDEAHNISEWGTEDFRPEFSRISSLLGRLPAGVPVIAASATVPPEVILDIQDKLGFGRDSECISVSNEKLNVALSVRTLQHPRDSFADLLFLFPSSGATAMDFIQTIIYVNSRQEAERIQDFLRQHSPEYISYVSFEFYHRYISEDRKAIIEEAIANGTLRGTAATDALGMASFGMDFRGIKRVILWIEPRTFNSLVQKIGRCVRIFSELGEAIVFITKASLKRFLIEFDLDSVDGVNDSDGAPAGEEPEWEEPSYRDQTEEEEPRDDDEVEDEDEEEGEFIGDFLEDHFEDIGKDAMNASDNLVEPIPTRRKVTKRKKVLTHIEARDRWFLLWFLTTEKCRRIPWNKFFGNCSKLPSPFPAPLGSRCCDNCEPLQFPVEAIRLTDPDQLRLPGRAQKSSPEVAEAVRSQLLVLREKLVADIYGSDQYMVTGKMILPAEIINVLAKRARFVDSVEALKQCVYWHFAHEFGNDVVLVLTDVLANFPDSVQKTQELQQRERALRALLKMEKRDLKNQISSISESCFVAVKNEMDGTRQVCKPFLRLPRKNVYPDYYNIIKTPISMANIAANVKRGNVYESVAQYSSDWDLMFENAREYNEDVSTIYNDTYILQHVFQNALEAATRIHGIILNDPE
ncbi:hypothetical protein HHX47_DHR3000514 [Lentinula edodes]|nr:hypothetical protein HHX47_DHR3000514 [Lentinula edodes]